MRRPIKSKWLIRLASELAGEGAGQGQPRNTNLRRAASTAYYALFHAIGTAVAAEALPSGSDAEKSGYGRYVNHAAIKQVCDWISGSQPPVHLQDVVTRLRQNSRLSAVASSFRDPSGAARSRGLRSRRRLHETGDTCARGTCERSGGGYPGAEDDRRLPLLLRSRCLADERSKPLSTSTGQG